MTLDKRTRERLLAHCGQLHEDDGVDPRQFFKTAKSGDNQHHKTLRLCNQVAQTLSLVLAGDFGDAILQELQVVSVTPVSGAAQLLVKLSSGNLGDSADGADTDNDCVEIQEIMDRLAVVSGRIRSAVAAAITRKRAPRLLFQIVGPQSEGEVSR